jgi:S-formylglutathione hydrolase FrmB
LNQDIHTLTAGDKMGEGIMSFCTVKFWSQGLGRRSTMNLFIPEGRSGPFPVLILLHGYSDDYSIWQRQTSLERYLEGLPLIVAMPDGGRSFYMNDDRPGGDRTEDHIVRDVVGYLDRTFQTIPHREGRAIAGLSMGGYGAAMLALRHPDLFTAAVSHSGAFGPGVKKDGIPPDPGIKYVFNRMKQDRYNCFALAGRVLRKGCCPAFRFDCGTADFLYEENRKFHVYLDRIGFPHEYEEHGGGHEWRYWDKHIPETLRFVLRHTKR